MNKTKIEWCDIPGYPGYKVTAGGLIAGPKGILKPICSRDGYAHVFAYDGGASRKLRVHHAVLFAFVGPPAEGQETRHLDGDPHNNRLDNLAWGTRRENAADKQRHGRLPAGERSGTHKLTAADVIKIRRLHGALSLRQLATRFGVSHTAIRRAALGISWSCLKGGAS